MDCQNYHHPKYYWIFVGTTILSSSRTMQLFKFYKKLFYIFQVLKFLPMKGILNKIEKTMI